MQIILSEEEYNKLKNGSPNRESMSHEEITAYMKRLPHFGPATINTMLDYFAQDNIAMTRPVKD